MNDTQKKNILKIIICGDYSVGKSSILKRYVNDTYGEQYKATIGVDFLCKDVMIGEDKVTLQLWDGVGSGRERFISTTRVFYRGAHGTIAIFDVTRKESFDHVRNWIDDAKRNVGDEDPMPFVILGNKEDLNDLTLTKRKDRVITKEMGQQMASEYGASYFEVSAKTGKGLKEAMQAFNARVWQVYKSRAPPDSIHYSIDGNMTPPPKSYVDSVCSLCVMM